jgi:hypothetical protein
MMAGIAMVAVLALVVDSMRYVRAQVPAGGNPTDLVPHFVPDKEPLRPFVQPPPANAGVSDFASNETGKPRAAEPKKETAYDLLVKLRHIRAQQAELAKKEAQTMEQLKKEVQQLNQESKQLGITLEETAQPNIYNAPPKPADLGVKNPNY